jgi:hypothetical protein
LQKGTSFKIITPILLGVLLFAALITPLHAITPARDLTGTWKNTISETYYEMDPSDPTTRMNDVKVTYSMVITQSGNSINIVLNVYESSWVTDVAYSNYYGMSGVPPVGYNQIVLSGTISGASFVTDEMGGSTGTAEHLAGTFTSDIITATLTGNAETTDTNGIIVLRSGSSATMPPTASATPIPTPAPAPALPTTDNLGSVGLVQGLAWLANTGASVTTQSQIGTGAEIQTGNNTNTIVGFNYPDLGGTVYLGANSDAGWVYLKPQTDSINGNISYTAVPPPATGTFSYSEGIEPEEFGQAGASLAAEVAVGLVFMATTGAPITLTGALVVEGTILLGTGIAYIHEQLSPQEGTYDVRPVQVPQGLVMGEGTDYVVQVSNGWTTIQVISGSVIFIDQYTNNSITIAANQMLTLPPSQAQVGFSQQNLQSYKSTFDATLINQWWTQITPTDTPTAPTDTALVATPTTNAVNGFTNFLSSTLFLVFILLIIVIIITAILVTKNRKTQSRKPSPSNQNIPQTGTFENPKATTSTTAIPPPPLPEPDVQQPKPSFCPNCGNKLLNPKEFCPFCGSNINK